MAINQHNDNANKGTGHSVCINNRNSGEITGAKDVISFDLEEIVIETVMGVLKIKGKELHVKSINLDMGKVSFEGNVDEAIYEDSKSMKRRSLMGRLFG